MNIQKAIGIFDSGFGGLTVFKAIAEKLPQYNYIYLGDNARSPYGDHSFDDVYTYTWECVQWLFKQGCPLVILACNTASAKALKNIQQLNLPNTYPDHRVLGVIRPTAEVIGDMSTTKSVGVLGTRGTVNSESYVLEIKKFSPEVNVFQQSCPMWVPIIEKGGYDSAEIDVYVKQYLDDLLQQSDVIDTILLACTHYPLLIPKIKQYISPAIKLVPQGEIIANSLISYLNRHPEIDSQLAHGQRQQFFTTGDAANFSKQASVFLGKDIVSTKVKL